MNLEDKITESLKTAMKAKDTIALESLRAIKAAILLAKTDEKNSSKTLSKDQETTLLQKLLKQRIEAAEQFSALNRLELSKKEQLQAEIIRKFLPEPLSESALIKELMGIIKECHAQSSQDFGKVMKIASERLKGRADGKHIASLLKELL